MEGDGSLGLDYMQNDGSPPHQVKTPYCQLILREILLENKPKTR